MPPHLKCKEGDIVYVRGIVLSTHSDAFEVRFERYNFVAKAWVPAGDVAKLEDIQDMPPMPRQVTPRLFE